MGFHQIDVPVVQEPIASVSFSGDIIPYLVTTILSYRSVVVMIIFKAVEPNATENISTFGYCPLNENEYLFAT